MDDCGHTAAYEACRHHHLDALRALAEAGADLEKAGTYKLPPGMSNIAHAIRALNAPGVRTHTGNAEMALHVPGQYDIKTPVRTPTGAAARTPDGARTPTRSDLDEAQRQHESGESPLHRACEKGFLDIVQVP